MEYTGNHFKDLYNTTKEKGLVSALKFDLERTGEDLEGLLSDFIMGAILVPMIAILTPYVVYRFWKLSRDGQREWKKLNKVE